MDGREGVELVLDGRTPVVRRTAPSEGEAAVGRALAVDECVAVVVEGRAVVEPDRCPDLIGEGFGRDHVRVERHDVPAAPRERGGVPLGREHDLLGRDTPTDGLHPARANSCGAGLLEDPHPTTFRGSSEPVGELRRLYGGTERMPRTGEHVGSVERGPGLVAVEEPHLVLTEALGARLLHLGTRVLDLEGQARQGEDAARCVVAVDALIGGQPADVADALVEGRSVPIGGTATVIGHELCVPQRVGRMAPPAVPPGCPKPDMGRFEDDDVERGVDRGEVVRTPQAGESPSHDGNVTFE